MAHLVTIFFDQHKKADNLDKNMEIFVFRKKKNPISPKLGHFSEKHLEKNKF